MLGDLKKELEQIRQAIADGDEEATIEMLNLRISAHDPLHDTLVLLETRHSNLQQSIIEGVISREDENIERNGIIKGLLTLLKTLETRTTAPVQIAKTHSTGMGKLDTRKWVIAAGILLAVAIVWGIVSWALEHPSAPETRDLSLRLAVMPSDVPIEPLGKAQIEVGDFVSKPLNVPTSKVLVFKNTPIKAGRDSVKLLLPDLKYTHNIVCHSGDAASGFSFHVILKTTAFSGKVLRPDLRPAPNVELEIEDGLARATTDAKGNFSFVLPDWGATNVRLVMRREGKVLLDKRMGLNAEVFKELKTPD